ncbi:hypothetical protein WJX72_008744 [[Myrmecia] bisecta]|uniref:C2 domain-containing protein n=1 Tax=[Myrmecia] bisecta TaxID=41462 RepID=A0AAW1QS04_9CHLO
MAVVRISNLDGQFTVDKELIGHQDPYCIFELGSSKVTTKALKGAGKEAHWTEQYALENVQQSSATQPMHVAVYNHNTLRPDSLIGQGTLKDITSAEGSVARISLSDKKEKYVGDLTFRVAISGLKGAGTGAAGARTAGAAGLGAGATGAGVAAGHHGVGTNTAGTGNRTTGEKVASHIPGTEENREKRAGTAAGVGAGAGVAGAGAAGAHHHEGHRVSGITGNEFGSNTTGNNTTGTRGVTGTGSRMETDREAAREKLENMRVGDREGHHHTGAGVATGTATGAGIGGAMAQHNREHQQKVAGEHLSGARDTETYREGNTVTTKTTAATEGVSARGPACETKYYTTVEDRPIVKEHVTYVREHHPVEKEFVVETRHTGKEREAGARHEEVIDQRERVVDATKPSPCEGHPRI